MRGRLFNLIGVAFAAGLLMSCSDSATSADQTSTTPAESTATFVCFKIAGDPGPDRFRAFAELVEQYPPAAGHAVRAGYKRDAAVSVKMQPDEDAGQWIDDIPDALRQHEIVSSVDAEDHDCGEVQA